MSNYSDSSFDTTDESNGNTSWYKIFHLTPPGSSVLDIGCSSGNLGQLLIQKRQCRVNGVELNPADAKLAAGKLHRVWVLDIEGDDLAEFGKNKYDVIIFGEVIEHLVKPTETLKRIKPLLNNKGMILFSIPNMAHIAVRLALLRGNFEYTETGLLDKTHVHFYDQHEVERVFGEAGYEITNLEFVKKDYPRELLHKELKKMGLNPTEKFYNLAAKPDASAFQFVGKATPSEIKHHKLAEFGPIDMFNNFYENTKLEYEQRIKELMKKLEKTQQNVKSIQRNVESVQKELKYKVEHPYRSVAGHVKRKVKSKL